MPLDWTPLGDIVRLHQRFLLTTHIRPDGDALGSVLGLAELLRARGKDVQAVVSSSIAPRYHFLNTDGFFQHFVPPGDAFRAAEVVVVLDTGTWNQLGAFGPFLRELPAVKVVIDHHLTQDDLQAVRFVDTSVEATGRLVYQVHRVLGVPLTEKAATGLFVALAMDTGWFRHSNTTPATFALAGELTAAGARPERLYEVLFEQNTLGRLRLMGVVLERLQVTHDGRVAHTEIRRGDYETTGATPQDTEDLVNFTRSVAGVEVGLFFMEQPRGGVKVSFRSRERVDVARVAEQFGGGGHRLASGAVVQAPLDEVKAQVLQAVGSALTSHP
jgi:phosphoesterase RecJ-like protein